MSDCLICAGPVGDAELGRVQVWENELWRVTVSLQAPVLGFSYLEPKRHIPYITDLDGPEAATLGETLAALTSTLAETTEADIVYVNVFGERIAHLHFNIAPHRAGDPLTGGAGMIAEGAHPLPAPDLRATADDLESLLADRLGR